VYFGLEEVCRGYSFLDESSTRGFRKFGVRVRGRGAGNVRCGGSSLGRELTIGFLLN
jgi:hypothetical protein